MLRDRQLLKALQRMINEDGTPYSAPWKQIPKKYQKDFKSWIAEYKQQSWDGMWEKGWFNYQYEYLRFLIDMRLMEDEKPHEGAVVDKEIIEAAFPDLMAVEIGEKDNDLSGGKTEDETKK